MAVPQVLEGRPPHGHARVAEEVLTVIDLFSSLPSRYDTLIYVYASGLSGQCSMNAVVARPYA
jgi:hypothetical protein